MDILLAVLQLLFTYLNENFDKMDALRQRRDLEDPVIIPDAPVDQPAVQPELVVPQREVFIPETNEENENSDTPGFITFSIEDSTTDGPRHKLDVNLYSEPFCSSGFYPLPGLLKDIFITISMFIHFVQLLKLIQKAALNRRRRLANAQNHPVNRPILGQLGKLFFNDCSSLINLIINFT